MGSILGTRVQDLHFSRPGPARALVQKELGPALIALDEKDPASGPTGNQHEARDSASRSQIDDGRGGFLHAGLGSVHETESVVDLVADGHPAQKSKLR